jgi:hypothetical protein
MVNQQLLDYVKRQLEKNVSKEQIKGSLMANGWDASDVEEGFAALAPIAPPAPIPHVLSPVQPVQPIQPTQTIQTAQPTQPVQPVQPVQPIQSFINPRPVEPVHQPVANQTVLNPTLVNSAMDTSVGPKNPKPWKKVVLAVLLVIILAVAGWFAYKYFYSSKASNQTAEVPVVNQEVAQTPPLQTAENPATTETTPPPSQNTTQPTPPLQIVSMSITPSAQLTYPFSGNTLSVVLKNNTSQTIKAYLFRFYLDENNNLDNYNGADASGINIPAGGTFNMKSFDLKNAVGDVLKTSCDFTGMTAGQYHLHLKVSPGVIGGGLQGIETTDTGPSISDMSIPFTLTASCKKIF